MEKPDILLPTRCMPGQHAGNWGVKLVRSAGTDAAKEEASIDIVAVHGLNGHWERSWTSKTARRNWLSDLLPEDIPSARILSYGYNARTHGGKDGSSIEFFHEHAEDFLSKLQEFRERTKTERQPIIFLAHSLGGLLVKEMLIRSSQCSSAKSLIKGSTLGVVFFGTPHFGSTIAFWGNLALKLLSCFVNTNTRFIRHLGAESELLRSQDQPFRRVSANIDLIFVCETKKTKVLPFKRILIVSTTSAVIPGHLRGKTLSWPRDHQELIRFDHDKDENYQSILYHLRQMVESSATKSNACSDWNAVPVTRPQPLSRAPTFTMALTSLPNVPVWMENQQQTGSFFGREKLLTAMKSYMFPTGNETEDAVRSTRVLVLSGMGGVGKTRTAAIFAAQFKERFSAVVWVDGSNETNTLLSLRSFAQRYVDAVWASSGPEGYQALTSRLRIGDYLSSTYQLSTDSRVLSKIAQAVMNFFSVDDGNFTWLWILDNVDDAEYPAKKYMPQSPTGRIIITSRLTAAAQLGFNLPLEVMDENEAVKVILENAPYRVKTGSDTNDAIAIAKELGYLPLALENAGAFISETQIALSEYLPKLKSHLRDMLRFSKSWGPERSVFTTWEISFQRLAKKSPTAAELLQVLGFLDRQMIWEEMFLAKSPGETKPFLLTQDLHWLQEAREHPFRLTQAFQNLFVASLAKRSTDGFINIHPLVHTWARERVDLVDHVRKNIQAVIVIGQIIENLATTLSSSLNKLLPHAQTCMDLICEHQDENIVPLILQCPIAARSFYQIGVLMKTSGSVRHAKFIFEAFSSAENLSSSLLTLNSSRWLGELLILESRYPEAEELLARVRALLAKSFGESHPDTLAAEAALGMVYRRCYQFEKAESTLLSVIVHDTKLSGTLGKYGREASSSLALLYRQKGRFQEAVALLDRALADATDEDGDMADLLTLKHRRAIILHGMGQWKEAATAMREVHSGRKNILGRSHPETLRTANALGRMCCYLGQLAEARTLLEEAWRGQEALGFGPDETSQLRTLLNIGVLNREEGRYDEAADCLARALAAERRHHGPEAPSALECQQEIGVLQTKCGDFDDAVETLSDLLASQLKTSPKAFVMHLSTRIALADAQIGAGWLGKAKTTLESTARSADVVAQDSPVFLMLQVTSARLALEQGELEAARLCLMDPLDELPLVLGENHPVTLNARAISADCLSPDRDDPLKP